MDALIALEGRKVELLKAMRSHVMLGKALPPGFAAESPLDELLGRAAAASQQAVAAATHGSAFGGGRGALEHGSHNRAADSYGGARGGAMDDHLSLRAVLPFDFTVVASAVMPFKVRGAGQPGRKGAESVGANRARPGGAAAGAYLNLLAVAGSDGLLRIIDPDELGSSPEQATLLTLGPEDYAALPPADSASSAASAAAGGSGSLALPATRADDPAEGCGLVTHLSFDGGSSVTDAPLLAVGLSGGRVGVLSLTLWRDGSVVGGQRTPKLKLEADGATPLPGQALPEEPARRLANGLGLVAKLSASVHVGALRRAAAEATARVASRQRTKDAESPSGGLMGAEERSAAAEAAAARALEDVARERTALGGGTGAGVTALLLYSARVSSAGGSGGSSRGAGDDGETGGGGGDDTGQRRLVAVGDSFGGLFSFDAKDGTLLRNSTVSRLGDYARDLKKSGASLAVAEGGGVSFLSASRFTFSAVTFCKGGASAAVSLAYDVLSPGLLYAAFANGEVTRGRGVKV